METNQDHLNYSQPIEFSANVSGHSPFHVPFRRLDKPQQIKRIIFYYSWKIIANFRFSQLIPA